MLWRFFLPGGYSPNRLVQGLASDLDRPDSNLQGLHIFTFNELAKTEQWRRDWAQVLGQTAALLPATVIEGGAAGRARREPSQMLRDGSGC